jgi:hypothetical protein
MAEEKDPRKLEDERERVSDESAKAKASGDEAELAEDLDVQADKGVDDIKGGMMFQ